MAQSVAITTCHRNGYNLHINFLEQMEFYRDNVEDWYL